MQHLKQKALDRGHRVQLALGPAMAECATEYGQSWKKVRYIRIVVCSSRMTRNEQPGPVGRLINE